MQDGMHLLRRQSLTSLSPCFCAFMRPPSESTRRPTGSGRLERSCPRLLRSRPCSVPSGGGSHGTAEARRARGRGAGGKLTAESSFLRQLPGLRILDGNGVPSNDSQPLLRTLKNDSGVRQSVSRDADAGSSFFRRIGGSDESAGGRDYCSASSVGGASRRTSNQFSSRSAPK